MQPACDIVRIKYMQVALESAAKASASGFGGIAAVLVDPTADQVLAVASRTDRHPLRHPVMQCIDKFAKKLAEADGQRAHPTAKAAAGKAVPPKVQVAAATASERASAMPTKRKLDEEEQYLCSGFDLYTTVEPCTM